MEAQVLKVRRATPSDLPFVHSSWFSEAWKEAKARVARSVYEPGQDALIDALIDRSDVYVAYFVDVPDEIAGYAVLEWDTCHMVYVKSVYRGQGIGTGLVKGRCVWYSQWLGGKANKFATSRGMQFNPYKAQEPT